MTSTPSPLQPNTLGRASLILGILSISLVFGLGICGLFVREVPVVNLAILICIVSSAFLGFIGAILGFGGLFGANRQRGTAAMGLFLGLGGLCLFLVILSSVS